MLGGGSAVDQQLSSFWKKKYEKEAGKHWNLFYKRNKANFFKDRHYLGLEFDALAPNGCRRNLLELGCGVGNTVFPLVEKDELLRVHCCDFSVEAIKLVKENPKYNSERINAFVCDLTQDRLEDNVPSHSVQVATLIFVISAIPPHKLLQSLLNIAGTLEPGAHVLVRDYAVGDLAEERLNEKKAIRKMDENYYIRGDGTFVHCFSEESLKSFFESTGCFECLSIMTHDKEIENRKKQLAMKRHWVQAVFRYLGVTGDLKDPKDFAGGAGGKSTHVCEWEPTNKADSMMQGMFDQPQTTLQDHITISPDFAAVSVVSIHKEHLHSQGSTGTMLWEGSVALARLIASSSDQFSGKKVIDLGCGCSPLSAVALTKAKADSIVITDGSPAAIEMLRENVQANMKQFAELSSVQLAALSWDEDEDIHRAIGMTGDSKGFDIVVASDVLYIEDAIPLLFRTAARLLKDAPSSFFVICYTPRRAIEQKVFAAAQEANLDVVDAERQTLREAFEQQNAHGPLRMLQFEPKAQNN